MTTKKSITVHCWRPNLQLLAAGVVLAGGTAGLAGASGLLGAFSWETNLKLLAGLLLLGYWGVYCRVRVTPYEVRVLGSGLWKGCYSCPLEETDMGFQLLPEWVAQANYYSPCLSFFWAEDWDTGIDYVEIEFYREQVLNCFREQQLPEILAALRTMAAHRRELETAPILSPGTNA